jgi:hypothetical protein
MVAAAEAWVLERGLAMLRLKTNAARKDAHRFYERMGFENVKEQIVYVKKLGAGRGAGYIDGVERDGGDTMRPSAAR